MAYPSSAPPRPYNLPEEEKEREKKKKEKKKNESNQTRTKKKKKKKRYNTITDNRLVGAKAFFPKTIKRGLLVHVTVQQHGARSLLGGRGCDDFKKKKINKKIKKISIGFQKNKKKKGKKRKEKKRNERNLP